LIVVIVVVDLAATDAGHDSEALPARHALLPYHRVRGDDVEAERVVQLVDTHHLHVVPGDRDVPHVVVIAGAGRRNGGQGSVGLSEHR
jgi:hypothetical protein